MMRSARIPDPARRHSSRAGVSTLDYVLVIGIVLPLLAIVLPMGRRAMQLVYEMSATLISWPFM